jgi:hypothetical protein
VTYLAVLGACALDAVLPVVPSEAVVIAASILATRGELWIWLVALAAAAGGFLGDTGSYLLGRTAGASAARWLFRSPKAKGRLSWAGEALERLDPDGAPIPPAQRSGCGEGHRARDGGIERHPGLCWVRWFGSGTAGKATGPTEHPPTAPGASATWDLSSAW